MTTDVLKPRRTSAYWLHFYVVRIVANKNKRATDFDLYLNLKTGSIPNEFSSTEQALSTFCYPLGADSQKSFDQKTKLFAPEEYTFTLTQGDGTRVQGFCRRVLPAGKGERFAQVLCLLCEANWLPFFYKVLEVTDQLLQHDCLLRDCLLDPLAKVQKDLPVDSCAGSFLSQLGLQLAGDLSPGCVLRVPLPRLPTPLLVDPMKAIATSTLIGGQPLELTPQYIDLQVPPNCGTGHFNGGVSLARLLWTLPVPSLMTLIASLLLERRIVLVSMYRETVSAAVHAAAALIYPFRWHHIYLPLLPKSFKDYLSAPMPFLIGMPAAMLDILKKDRAIEEVTVIDLDMCTSSPPPGSPQDEARLLPWRERLEAALHAAYGTLKSPTEFESNVLISGIMQEYFLKLIGQYRKFITLDITPAGSRATTSSPGGRPNDNIKGHGFKYDHTALTSSHRRSERARHFLQLMRHSQMYEVFIQERLRLAGEEFLTDDSFELKVTEYVDKRDRKLAGLLAQMSKNYVSKVQGKVSNLLGKKHRRTETDGAISVRSGASVRRSGTADELEQRNGPLQVFASRSEPGTGPKDMDLSLFFEDDDVEEEAEALFEAQSTKGSEAGSLPSSRNSSSNSLVDLARTSINGKQYGSKGGEPIPSRPPRAVTPAEGPPPEALTRRPSNNMSMVNGGSTPQQAASHPSRVLGPRTTSESPRARASSAVGPTVAPLISWDEDNVQRSLSALPGTSGSSMPYPGQLTGLGTRPLGGTAPVSSSRFKKAFKGMIETVNEAWTDFTQDWVEFTEGIHLPAPSGMPRSQSEKTQTPAGAPLQLGLPQPVAPNPPVTAAPSISVGVADLARPAADSPTPAVLVPTVSAQAEDPVTALSNKPQLAQALDDCLGPGASLTASLGFTPTTKIGSAMASGVPMRSTSMGRPSSGGGGSLHHQEGPRWPDTGEVPHSMLPNSSNRATTSAVGMSSGAASCPAGPGQQLAAVHTQLVPTPSSIPHPGMSVGFTPGATDTPDSKGGTLPLLALGRPSDTGHLASQQVPCGPDPGQLATKLFLDESWQQAAPAPAASGEDSWVPFSSIGDGSADGRVSLSVIDDDGFSQLAARPKEDPKPPGMELPKQPSPLVNFTIPPPPVKAIRRRG